MPNRLKHAKILKIAVYLFIATTAIFLLTNFAFAAIGDLDNLFSGTGGAENTAKSLGLGSANLIVTVINLIRIVIGFLGLLAVGLIIYGGFVWMTSAGNEQKIEQAKNILKNAVIGLIIILFSFALVSFILNLLTGATTGGGPNGPNGGQPINYGLGALGNGIIESHYPARDQKEVPRNTSIIITFREPMKASTLCVNPIAQGVGLPDRCMGGNINVVDGDINKNVIRIFRQTDAGECTTGPAPSAACDPLLVKAKVYSTVDGKTFVFKPNDYLGSSTEYINYTVYLGNGLLRQSGEKAFPGLEGDYGWSFEVSNKVDLTPPQVMKNGVFPAPDNGQDTPGAVISAVQASGTITVKATPSVYSDASVLSVVKNPLGGGWSDASATVNKNCGRSGIFTVSVDSNQASIIILTDSNNNLLGQGSVSGKTVSFAQLCNLNLTTGDANFTAGNSWQVAIKAMTTADTIIVGNITYTASGVENINNHNFRVYAGDNNATAQSIINVLANNQEIKQPPTRALNVVTVKAKVAGEAGNNIVLSSSNQAALTISPIPGMPGVFGMSGGTDRVENVIVNGIKDQPMNTAIQINFNEAIMPLTVSGTSEELKDFIRVVNADSAAKANGAACAADEDCLSYKCAGTCVADSLAGKFTVSNQYGTVNFLSDKECGFNSCGEKIYCLPANSHLKIELNAADLISCGQDSDCQTYSPFNICDPARKFCRDSGSKYYPQADQTNVNGLVDAAFNSLDGNRDNSAYGPASYYNENTPAPNDGDSFKWSFFVSNALDLTPPKINTTDPAIVVPPAVSAVDLVKPIKISFDKLMLSSRLITGSLTIRNGDKNIQHYLLNLRSLADQPLGYWVTNITQYNVGGEPKSTDAYINHSRFNGTMTYKAQAGSGLKDIYQNCFLPCAGPACTGASQVGSQKPCCCNGVPGESCP